jgi:hypothetical protein
LQSNLNPLAEDLGADWSCVGQAPERDLTPGSTGASVLYSLRLVDLATGAIFPQINVRACALVDINCTNPVTAQLVPAEDGWVDVPLTENFRGYLEIVSPRAVPYLFHLPDAELRTTRDFPLAMVALESFGALLGALNVQADPSLGAIGMRAFDCSGEPAPGVVFKTTSGGIPWYFEGGLPNRERVTTDSGGLGGFIGSQPGVTVLEASLPDGTVTTGGSYVVRAGWMTSGYLRPTR